METKAAANKVEEVLHLDEYPWAPSSLPSPPLHGGAGGSTENITRIDRELYFAAAMGNFQAFIDIQNLESLLTPNKNTVLHIHLTSTITETTLNVSLTFFERILGYLQDSSLGTGPTPPAVSEQFVNQILDKCRNLLVFPNAKGETLLHIAARYGHSKIATLLIERVKKFPPDIENGVGAEQKKFIRATNNEKDTALHEAVRHDHIEVVKTLLEMDPDYSYHANNDNETPLYLASERRYQQVVAVILNKVKSPSYGGPNDRTALHAAVLNHDIEMTRDLLKNEHVRVAVKHVDEKGWIPLHYAVEIGNLALTKLLLKQDENTAYMQDNDGMTALHMATSGGWWDIMEMFIQYYPDCLEIVDNKGWNALHYSVNRAFIVQIYGIMSRLWLSNLYNEKDLNGNTPLHLLANSGFFNNILVSHPRVDKQTVNKEYQTAVDLAGADSLTKQGLIKRLKKAGVTRSQRLYQNSQNAQEKSDVLVLTKEAKESHLLVATLIATVSFAAGITLPGGTIQDGDHQGSPILGHKASFKAFMVSNTLAMVMAAFAAFIHLFSPLNKSKWKDCFLSEIAFSFILIAFATMIVAFATGTYAVLGSSSVGIAVITIGLFFFLAFRHVVLLNVEGAFFLTCINWLMQTIFFLFCGVKYGHNFFTRNKIEK